MVFKVKKENTILKIVLAFSIPIVSSFLSKEVYYFYMSFLLLLVLLVSCIQFELTIGDVFLLDEIVLFRKSIYKKRMDPKQIKQIKFTRIGWNSKGAIIQMKKGFGIKVTHYDPDSFIAKLMEFAHKYEIPIAKTKDFKIMEKWKM